MQYDLIPNLELELDLVLELMIGSDAIYIDIK